MRQHHQPALKTTRMKLLSLIILFISVLNVSASPEEDSTIVPEENIPVVVFDDTLFSIYHPLGPLSIEERAERIRNKVLSIYENEHFPVDSIRVVPQNEALSVIAGSTIIMSIRDIDAKAWGMQHDAAGQFARDQIVLALQTQRAMEHPQALTKRLILAGISVVLLIVVIWLIGFLTRWMKRVIIKWKGHYIKGVRIRNYVLLTEDRQIAFLHLLLAILRISLIIFAFFIFLPTVMSLFPFSHGWADTLFDYILTPLKKILSSVVHYIPNLITITIIVLVTHFSVKGLGYLANEIEKGKLHIPNFYPDWAKPTFAIIRFIVYAFMFVVIFPYLPGSNSVVFKGVTIFLGFLFSLSSSSTIGNIMAGISMTYMRPFLVGDIVKIGDVYGQVTEKSLIVTRLLTIKNENVTIPNSMLINTYVKNLTRAGRNGLLLHTEVTIGYDAPWRKVHELLIAAAKATKGCMAEHEPFVLQIGLNDFYVTYQINMYTQDYLNITQTYSELHQNIQDKFFEAGMEIMSPHFTSLRDGNMPAIPASYLPSDFITEGFRVKGFGRQ